MGNADYASLCWTVDDVIENANELGISIPRGRAERLLRDHERHIEDAMVGAGWQVIEAVLTVAAKNRIRSVKS